jgi:magnesium chelatase subunit I
MRTFGPAPQVDLPLGATEDRVCGTIDIEKALTEGRKICGGNWVCCRVRNGLERVLNHTYLMRVGVKAFEPGLLAKANRGILYVDEVNLLDDHLVRTSGVT